MAKFHIYQRVKLARAVMPVNRVHLGHEGRLLSGPIYGLSIVSRLPAIGYQFACDCGYSHLIDENCFEPLLKRPELGSIEELFHILGGWKPGVSKHVKEKVA